MKKVCLILVLLMVAGCPQGFSNLSKEDQMAQVGMTMKDYYKIVYDKAMILSTNGSDSQKAYIKKYINPKLNDVQDLIGIYLLGVYDWKLTKQGDVASLEKQSAAIMKILTDIQLMLAQGPQGE